MSDPRDHQDEPQVPAPAAPDAGELSGEALDSVSGGVIDGGCTTPIPLGPPPTFPDYPGGCFPTDGTW